MDAAQERLLDRYLAQLRRELQASPQQADEVLREVRSHFELAVWDAEQRGRDPATAFALAMTHFGDAAQIGRELRQIHGCATWTESLTAVAPLFLFGWLGWVLESWLVEGWLVALKAAIWIAATCGWLAGGWGLSAPARRGHQPFGWDSSPWWWAWLGWLPFVLPNTSNNLLWSALFYAVLMALVSRRGWFEATLALYPLATAWAFRFIVLGSNEVQGVGWSPATLNVLGLALTAFWSVLLVRALRTPPGRRRIGRVLSGQAVIFALNVLVIAAARLWPTHPYPYRFSASYFVFTTLPYSIYSGLPFLLFGLLTSLPAILAFVRSYVRQRPPSRPVTSG